MARLRCLFSLAALLVCSIALPALGAEPWETAAIQGVRTMNLGDGKEFIKVTHTNTKTALRKFMLDRMQARPTSPATQDVLQKLSLANVEEAGRLPLDVFVERLIFYMHEEVPQPQRKAMEEAGLTAVSSELSGDTARVTVEMTYVAGGTPRTGKMLLLARREGDVWKYDGQTK